MGPDEQSASKYGMIITPINEDRTYGEPIKCGNLQQISDLQFIIDNTELSEEDLNKLYPNEKIKPLLVASWTGELNVKFRHQKMSKKTFKKWLMNKGFTRNDADTICKIIGSYRGEISYQSTYMANLLTPQSYIYIKGAKDSWMMK